ncbi:MAG: hypothetical protein HYV60_20890, partial [Planctomycetia bacterium]|nr:hypothetical protein [Planctomycetia bacterium]
EKPIEVRSLIGDEELPRQVSSNTWLTDVVERDEVLREAAMLGLDLLRGDDSLPLESALANHASQTASSPGPKAERNVA